MENHSELSVNGKLIAEAIVKALEANGIQAEVGRTYLDYGQGWTWDTIIVQTPTGSYQALNPRQHDAMNNGNFDFSDINQLVADAKKFNKVEA